MSGSCFNRFATDRSHFLPLYVTIQSVDLVAEFAGEDRYPGLIVKAAILGFDFISNHPFIDVL